MPKIRVEFINQFSFLKAKNSRKSRRFPKKIVEKRRKGFLAFKIFARRQKGKVAVFADEKMRATRKTLGEIVFLAFSLARIFRIRRFFRACRDFVLKANCHKQMSAEEQQQRFDDFEKQLNGRENRFDDLKR